MTMMPGLDRAVTVSFVLHIALIATIMIVTRGGTNFVMPPAYTVSLVSPPGKAAPRSIKARRVPGPKNLAKPAVEAEGVTLTEKTMPKPSAPDPSALASNKKAKRIAALKAQQKAQRYVADAKSALFAKLKLKKVKVLGESKASVKVVVRETSGTSGSSRVTDAQAGAMVEYIDMVTSLIQQEWVFLDASAGEIWATFTVRILHSGALVITGIEKSSGNVLFDRNARRAIGKASPVPPPPFQRELSVNFYPAENNG